MSCGRPPADGDEDDDPAELTNQPHDNGVAGTCMKCKEQRPAVVERNLLQYCEPCFRFHVRKKFRDQLQPAILDAREWVRKLDHAPLSILVVAKSFAATVTAMDLLTSICLPRVDVKAVKAKSSPFSRLEVLHIQDAVSDAIDQDAQAAFKDIAAQFGHQITSLRLSDLFTVNAVEGCSNGSAMHISQNSATSSNVSAAEIYAKQTVPAYTSNLFTPSAQQSLRKSLAHSYAMQYAQKAGHRLVVLCDTSTELAATIISSISHGQGHALGEMVSGDLLSINSGTARLIRPMVNLTQEDVECYAQPSVVPSTKQPSVLQVSGRTIDGIITDFVGGLQANYPSTVSTIGKTAAKLNLRSEDANHLRCSICCLPRDTNASQWRDTTAMTALHEHHTVYADRQSDNLWNVCYGCLVPLKETLLKSNTTLSLHDIHDTLPRFTLNPS